MQYQRLQYHVKKIGIIKLEFVDSVKLIQNNICNNVYCTNVGSYFDLS